jgi:low temperature requirement protein LtrA
VTVSTNEPTDERASTLELFLDLVFVFTVTQLTGLVSHPAGLADYGRAVLILAVTWWMYDGYVWLTGNVSMRPAINRIGIFAGMAGFLLMALAIPNVFTDTNAAVVFGAAYLVVTIVHAVMFSTAATSSAQAIRRIAPFNIAGALLVLAAAFVADDWRWTLWLAGALVLISSSLFGRNRGWSVSASHFVERHGLVIIVALGESVVAIGAGASGLELDAGLASTAVLALGLSAAMWWIYFDRDDEEAGIVMSSATGDERSHLGLSIAYVHLAMIAGIIVAAAGVKSIVAHPADPVEAFAAWNLAAGVALYLAGEAAFRYGLGFAPAYKRLITAVLILFTVPVGLGVNGVAQLAIAFALLTVLIVSEQLRWRYRRRSQGAARATLA